MSHGRSPAGCRVKNRDAAAAAHQEGFRRSGELLRRSLRNGGLGKIGVKQSNGAYPVRVTRLLSWSWQYLTVGNVGVLVDRWKRAKRLTMRTPYQGRKMNCGRSGLPLGLEEIRFREGGVVRTVTARQ